MTSAMSKVCFLSNLSIIGYAANTPKNDPRGTIAEIRLVSAVFWEAGISLNIVEVQKITGLGKVLLMRDLSRPDSSQD